jgi:hypothetical protein
MVGEWKDLPAEVKEDCAKLCRSCADVLSGKPNSGPWMLDSDGVNVEVSGKPGKWRHAWDDAWWSCKAAGIINRAGEMPQSKERGPR